MSSLSENIGVKSSNFIFVAIYISFANSLLEEFFFRGFAFLKLKEVSSRKFAYIFSALAFSIYHLAMMIGWFDIVLFTSDKSRILASSFLSPQELHKTKIERENNVCFIISRGLLRNHYR